MQVGQHGRLGWLGRVGQTDRQTTRPVDERGSGTTSEITRETRTIRLTRASLTSRMGAAIDSCDCEKDAAWAHSELTNMKAYKLADISHLAIVLCAVYCDGCSRLYWTLWWSLSNLRHAI